LYILNDLLMQMKLTDLSMELIRGLVIWLPLSL
jgi:hypothetical protein